MYKSHAQFQDPFGQGALFSPMGSCRLPTPCLTRVSLQSGGSNVLTCRLEQSDGDENWDFFNRFIVLTWLSLGSKVC